MKQKAVCIVGKSMHQSAQKQKRARSESEAKGPRLKTVATYNN